MKVAVTRLAVGVLCVAALTGPARAHETWLAPAAHAVEPGTTLTLSLTSGMSFPKLESPIRPERVATSGVRLHGTLHALGPWRAQSTALATSTRLARTGIATAWVALHPKDIDLSDAKVEEYFAEIGADSALRARWAGMRGRHAWHETYTKHAKTFVAVGDAAADTSWREPVGLAVELVPLFAPDRVRAGDEVAVQLLKEGHAEAGAVVVLMQAHGDRAFATTDDAGVARLRAKLAGPALFATVLLRPTPAGTAWTSDFSTLTVDVARGTP